MIYLVLSWIDLSNVWSVNFLMKGHSMLNFLMKGQHIFITANKTDIPWNEGFWDSDERKEAFSPDAYRQLGVDWSHVVHIFASIIF